MPQFLVLLPALCRNYSRNCGRWLSIYATKYVWMLDNVTYSCYFNITV